MSVVQAPVQVEELQYGPTYDPRKRVIHWEHPERQGEAWCGAPVIGVRSRNSWVNCVVCHDLLRARRRGAAGR